MAHPDVDVDGDFALIHLGLGEHDRAMDYLERGAAQRKGALFFIGAFPIWRVLRGNPRFEGLLTRIGIPLRRAEA